jgi:general secretion pathway protein G
MKIRGFTLIELLVVMAIIATLLSVVAPRYFGSVQRARETVLREDLDIMRDAIDKHFSDRGRYPDKLSDLVTGRYVRKIPVDPITQRADTWKVVPPADVNLGGMFDVKSGASGKALDGTPYGEL